MEEFHHIFEGVEDPRKSNATRHDLHEMLMTCLQQAGRAVVDDVRGRGLL